MRTKGFFGDQLPRRTVLTGVQQMEMFLKLIREKNALVLTGNWRNLMSYTEARSHPLGRSLLLSAGVLLGRMLPFHHHRHWPHVSFTAVIGMNVLQHCLSGQRSWVFNAPVKSLDALCVSAGTTDEPRTPTVFPDAVHS